MTTSRLGGRCAESFRDQLQPPIGDSPAMRRLRSLVEAIGRRPCTVIIHGESGSGKELIARYIHAQSPHRDGPFVPVDCTTLRDTLFESQLFGHVKGAFTGAAHATVGFFRTADGGTLFLDEIGEMSLEIQAKLLRCIQDRAVVPLGGVERIPVNVRILAATHRDLKAMVRRGEFRQDLYFRLNVVRVCVPPLRERRCDVRLLAEHFLGQFARIYEDGAKTLIPETLAALEAYDWPGNVRELANAMEQAHVLSENEAIRPDDLPPEIREAPPRPDVETHGEIPPLETAERRLVVRALDAAGGNQTRAAEILRIDRRRLRRKVRRYGLQAFLRQPNA